MIYTVTLNPTLDITLVIDRFSFGEPVQAVDVLRNPGGKGVNVSRVLRALGEDSVAVALAGGYVGEEVLDLLQQEGLILQVVKIKNPTRTNVVVFAREEDREMVIRASGPPIEEDEARRVDDLIAGMTHAPEVMVLSGSLPLGVSKDIYRKVTTAARGRGTKVFLDSAGEPLRLGIEAGPYLIKPNLRELSGLAGKELAGESEIVAYARDIIGAGVEVVVVSMGKLGAIMVTGSDVFRGTVPEVEEDTVGAGDSMVAGMVLGVARGRNLEESFCMGLSAALATVMNGGPLLADREYYDLAAPKVVVERI
ncbi:MAG: 1-phosphofructokinase family hexose kinase [Actinobacteria bacterium]|nr:1-phosphofructokinase family hexose kinase [Actinomycetota bacterium]MBU1943918.1 1-phosphofructokinase family hexose kinase [Actinomycetota bacterium]MBU2688560.1 1-phosphofructokinase family hexose kinase [Actinomycetota bacterium]